MKTDEYSRYQIFWGVALLLLLAGFVGVFLEDRKIMPSGEEPYVETISTDVIAGLEVHIPPSEKGGEGSVLKAAYAKILEDKRIHVYGGFEYKTGGAVITGDEAVINLKTGSVRDSKGVKIWTGE